MSERRFLNDEKNYSCGNGLCTVSYTHLVRTNVEGTDNVLHAAVEAGVKRIVCLSTDKAAYPINAMGIAKAMMEKVIGANARVAAGKTTICCTRYGNVMCSRCV